MISRLVEFEASCRRSFKEHELMHFDVYTTQEKKAGQVVDILVDEAGHLQYLVVELSDGTASKQIQIPYGEFQVDQTTCRIYINRINL